LRFNVTSLAAKAGKVKLVMSNPSSLTHSIAIEGNGVTAAGSVVTQGGTSTVSANLGQPRRSIALAIRRGRCWLPVWWCCSSCSRR
jgi:hypothetical protein